MNLKPLLRRTIPFFNLDALLQAWATWPGTRFDPCFVFEGEHFSYATVRQQALKYANWLEGQAEARRAAGLLPQGQPLRIGVYQDNLPEFIFLAFAAARINAVVCALNTGFRGQTLTDIVAKADVDLMVCDAPHAPLLAQALAEQPDSKNIYCCEANTQGFALLSEAVKDQLPHVKTRSIDPTAPFVIIYTSGTTGLPKGVVCSQMKILGAGWVTVGRVGVRHSDRGYVCTPLFHSSAWFLGVMPLLCVGASVVLTRRFSARAFEEDILAHGVTYMNYVGQPLHYILAALEKKHGSALAVEHALARNPRNRFRIAHGNGASAVDRQAMIRYLGMDHIYELYGSTEAAINTCNQPGDPPASVGRVWSRKVQILDENDRPCEVGEVDEQGRLLNYDQAVGEICAQVGRDTLLFDGYLDNSAATDAKWKNGWYRSGDLGHIRLHKGKRYLYFSGRTDDWIRKDGENFSARSVAEHVAAHPDVALVAAYGVPSEVSDERVMVSLTLNSEAKFDPQEFFEFLLKRQQQAGMDPKWMPDFVAVLPDLPLTETQKVKVRVLKKKYFDISNHPSMRVYFRQRGDSSFHAFNMDDYLGCYERFRLNGRQDLLAPLSADAS